MGSRGPKNCTVPHLSWVWCKVWEKTVSSVTKEPLNSD